MILITFAAKEGKCFIVRFCQPFILCPEDIVQFKFEVFPCTCLEIK